MGESPEPFILDVHALLAWANATGNESQTIYDGVKDGSIVIYNRVWNDFSKAFPDEAASLLKSKFIQ